MARIMIRVMVCILSRVPASTRYVAGRGCGRHMAILGLLAIVHTILRLMAGMLGI